MIRPGLEPGTFCVLDRCDNQLRHRTASQVRALFNDPSPLSRSPCLPPRIVVSRKRLTNSRGPRTLIGDQIDERRTDDAWRIVSDCLTMPAVGTNHSWREYHHSSPLPPSGPRFRPLRPYGIFPPSNLPLKAVIREFRCDQGQGGSWRPRKGGTGVSHTKREKGGLAIGEMMLEELDPSTELAHSFDILAPGRLGLFPCWCPCSSPELPPLHPFFSGTDGTRLESSLNSGAEGEGSAICVDPFYSGPLRTTHHPFPCLWNSLVPDWWRCRRRARQSLHLWTQVSYPRKTAYLSRYIGTQLAKY